MSPVTRWLAFTVRWILPPALGVLVFSAGLSAWFQQDDFAHLGLVMQVHSAADLVRALFRPVAQGTFRPLSERGFFMAFYSLFGLEALPYRMLVFLTQIGNICLVTAVGAKVANSKWAGVVASVLWCVNPTLATPLSWTSAYNQVLWTFTFLLAFYCLLRYWETGSSRYNVAQWAAYLVGFSVLELNVSYAPVATVYAFLFARRRLKSTLLLWIPALVYSAAHFLLIPKMTHGVYVLHLGGTMLQAFFTYWRWALGFIPPALAAGVPQWVQSSVLVAATTALLGVAAVQSWKRSWLPLFCLIWFVVTLAPVLPLTEHLTDYYVMVPSIGLAMMAGWALTRWKNPVLPAVGAGIAAAYLVCSVMTSVTYSHEIAAKSFGIRQLVEQVATAEEHHPGKAIMLTNVSDALFWSGIYDRPFRFVGPNAVYVAPESVSHLSTDPDIVNMDDYTLKDQAIVQGLQQGKLVVYAVGPDRLQNVTAMYQQIATRRSTGDTPARVEMANPLMQYLLDTRWYPVEGDFRWMPEEASVRVAAPEPGKQKLHIRGFCAPVQVTHQPLTLAVKVNGTTIAGRREIRSCSAPFDLEFEIPASAAAKREMLVTLSVDRAAQYGNDSRKLGLAVQLVEVR